MQLNNLLLRPVNVSLEKSSWKQTRLYVIINKVTFVKVLLFENVEVVVVSYSL